MIDLSRPNFWDKEPKSIIGYALMSIMWVPSLLYNLGFKINHLTKPPYAPKYNMKIICVGNAIIGGSGKTPVVFQLYQRLKGEFDNKKVIIMMKGYRGKISATSLVDLDIHSAKDVGDEAYMLAQKGCDVMISHNRKEGLKFAEKHGVDIILMDDGLQNPSVNADVNICVIDGGYGFGNGFMLPMGPLRQPLKWLVDKTDLFITISLENPSKDLSTFLNKKTYHARPQINPATPKQNTQYFAFAGIGRPDKFYDSLIQSGYNVVKTRDFPDHHIYSERDLQTLKDDAKAMNATLITTQKDAVKLPQDFDVEVVELHLHLAEEDELINEIKAGIN